VGRRLTVVIDERLEPGRLSTDDGDCKWKAQDAGPGGRFRTPAHGDGHGQGVLEGSGLDGLARERGPKLPAACPGDMLSLAAQGQEQVELLDKELIVIVKIIAEERK